jgi:hypothetical protein
MAVLTKTQCPEKLMSRTPLPNPYPHTPDGRYFLVSGRLWRLSNPGLDPEVREVLSHELMAARGTVRRARDDAGALAKARAQVDAAKHAFGERGPVWWTDGAPDYNRQLARNAPYAEWFHSLSTSVDPDR